MDSSNRPLSPHLQVYRPQLTSVLSITHRATGLLLALGTVMLVYWLLAAAAGPGAYATAYHLFGTWFGQLILILWSFALYFHLCNGIRHLFWDAGKGFELDAVYASGRAVLAATVTLTAATWIAAFALSGGGA